MEAFVRTDLASEWSEAALKAGALDGLETAERTERGVRVYEVNVKNQSAAERLHKPCGRYLTVFSGRLWEDDEQTFRQKAYVLAAQLRSLLPRGFRRVLLAGLGNRHITSDAVGPEALNYVLVTRHLKSADPELFYGLDLCECAALAPGVLGQTGIESAQILKGVVRDLDPDAVILIDALAARELDRLITTIQLSDTGLSPGSGVGNRRIALDKESLCGVPVCSIGVPTVVDAATLAFNVLARQTGESEIPHEAIQKELSTNGLNYFVTPKETDELLKQVSRLIGYGINLALHEKLSYEEMISLAE